MSRVIFGDVVTRANTKEDRFNTDRVYYVGGEHIDSSEVLIEKRGLIAGSTIGPMFYFGFKKGDVLFVSRNPHLRKSGMVTFDGICSEKTFVLRSKDENVLLQRYLAFVMQSDHFWTFMEAHKSGSVNYFINWSTLEKYEFELPDIDTQRKLADILWTINESKHANIRLIAATDELIKSQFTEMFKGKEFRRAQLKKIFVLQMGKTPPRAEKELWETADYKWISIADMSTYGKYTEDTKEYLSEIAVKKTGIKVVPKDTVIMSFKLTIGRTAITSEDIYTNEAIMAFIPKEDLFNNDYLRFALQYYDWTEGIQSAVKGATLNKDIIGNTLFDIPSDEEQKTFAKFAEYSEMSKNELQQTNEYLDELTRSILFENFK